MKTSSLDVAIGKLTEKIQGLETAHQHLLDVRAGLNGDAPDDQPKAKRGRKRKVGLPTPTPPASETNHLKGGDRL